MPSFLNANIFNPFQIIAMSGNVLCDQFIQTQPQSSAEELASRLDCSSMKGEDIVECLRRQTQQAIVTKTNSMTVRLAKNYLGKDMLQDIYQFLMDSWVF